METSMGRGRVPKAKPVSLRYFLSKCWLVFSPSFTETARRFETTSIFLMLLPRTLLRLTGAPTKFLTSAVAWRRPIWKYFSVSATCSANTLSPDTWPDDRGKSTISASISRRRNLCSSGYQASTFLRARARPSLIFSAKRTSKRPLSHRQEHNGLSRLFRFVLVEQHL